ncbi:TetR family transcriptional regulator [Paenibacillus sp. MBLB4367]|uniref:acyl-CoA-like ligand-binding transcription factor n=1 Tax=Paenibacillus sp. MBLB4367 TaxID=3384767 RepID=UPI00390837D0
MILDDQPKLGLRERKKLKTRATIQQNAIKLFREQGYHETTIEQIAEVSEVSPSTLFRYFPTKEALVLDDEFDPMLMELYRKQPSELSPIQAFRQAVRDSSALIPRDIRHAIRERMELIMSIPELRAANFSQTSDTLNMIAGLIAERAGRESGDLAVLAYAGSIVGAVLGAHTYCVSHPETDYVDVIEDALAALENGLHV